MKGSQRLQTTLRQTPRDTAHQPPLVGRLTTA